MKIRKGKISDARKIFNFLGSAPELHASKSNQDYDLKFVKSILNDKQSSIVIIAEEDKEIVGFIIGLLWPKIREAFTLDLFIRPEFRQRGIATKLNNEYERMLKEKDYNWITSFVLTNNFKMQKLKSKLNYKRGKKFIFYSKEIK